MIYLLFLEGMKNLSLKLDDALFDEVERLLKQVKKSRNRYINDAVLQLVRAKPSAGRTVAAGIAPECRRLDARFGGI